LGTQGDDGRLFTSGQFVYRTMVSYHLRDVKVTDDAVQHDDTYWEDSRAMASFKYNHAPPST
jgi:hypothetical protein